MPLREIVTVQLGRQANYLGTHFWNTQDFYAQKYAQEEDCPVDFDVNWVTKEGHGSDANVTPRVLIYDFKPNFGALRRVNELYEDQDQNPVTNNASRSSQISTHQEQQIEQGQYVQRYNNEDNPLPARDPEVRYWSDFSHIFYDPSSIVQISESLLDPGRRGFQTWHDGQELYKAIDRESNIYDEQLRPLIEQCDEIQGLQLISSVSDGWSGFASEYLQCVNDEVGNKQVWTWALSDVVTPSTANQIRAVCAMWEQASLYIPISDYVSQSFRRRLDLGTKSIWTFSGLHAAFMESVSLPTRLLPGAHNDQTSMERLASVLKTHGNHSIVESRLGFGDKFHGERLLLSPELKGSTNPRKSYADVEVMRGRARMAQTNGHGDEDHILKIYHSNLRFPLLTSYPGIFKPITLESQNEIELNATFEVNSNPVNYNREISNTTMRGLFGLDERGEIREELSRISDVYHTGWETDEPDGDDD